MDSGLKNKVVWLSAASDGIARAAAESFAREGAHLAMCARNPDKLRRAAAELEGRYGAQVLAEPLDVTDFKAVEAFVRRVAERFGRIDICLANAGGPPAKSFLSIGLDEWRGSVDLIFLSV